MPRPRPIRITSWPPRGSGPVNLLCSVAATWPELAAVSGLNRMTGDREP